jgi:hypothetical protein
LRFVRFAPIQRLASAALVAVLLLGLTGGHWAVLQSVAWAGMLVEYARAEGLRGGIERTFGGESPCDLCCAIEQGKAKEREREAPKVALERLKIEALLAWPAVARPADCAGEIVHAVHSARGGVGRARPEAPPPRPAA